MTNKTRFIVVALSAALMTVGFAGTTLAAEAPEAEAEASIFAKISASFEDLLVDLGVREHAPEPHVEASPATEVPGVEHNVTADPENRTASADVTIHITTEELLLELETVEAEQERLIAEIEAHLEEQQGASEQVVIDLEAKLTELQGEADRLRAELEAHMQETRASSEHLIIDLEAKLEELQKETENVEAKLTAHIEAHAEGGHASADATASADEVRSEVERLKGEVEVKKTETEGEVHRVKGEVDGKVTETTGEVEHLKGEVDAKVEETTTKTETDKTNVFEDLKIAISGFFSGIFGAESEHASGEASAQGSAEGSEEGASASAGASAEVILEQPTQEVERVQADAEAKLRETQGQVEGATGGVEKPEVPGLLG